MFHFLGKINKHQPSAAIYLVTVITLLWPVFVIMSYLAWFQGQEIASHNVKPEEVFPNLADDQINKTMDGYATIEECFASILNSKMEG